jgi:DNA polymerase-1
MPVKFSGGVVCYDLESHGVEELGTMPPENYVRLAQYSIDEGPVRVTRDIPWFRENVLAEARMIIGANIIGFDLPAVFGDTEAAVRLARQGRILDTHVFATIANPMPFAPFPVYTGGKPLAPVIGNYRKWIKLDQQAFALGVQGKTGDINVIADRFWYREEPILTKSGKPSLSKGVPRTRKVRDERTEGLCCKFAAIPVDDPEFLEYAERDVTVVREVARKMLERHPYTGYVRDEMLKAAIAVQIGRGNGFAVDLPATRQRERDLHEEAAWILDDLRDRYGMPVGTAKPLATNPGKAAVTQALLSYGVSEQDLARTATGAPSFGADSVVNAVAGRGEAAEAFGAAVAALAGQRSLAELLLDTVGPDGRVHPDIFAFQRSGRFSTTRPGLTVWDPRFRDLLVADDDEHLLVEFDYASADARAVAAMSGDREYAKRFEPGADNHLITAWVAWGKDVVGTDKHDPQTAAYRKRAKAPGLGWGYKMGPRKMAQTTGLSEAECRKIVKNLNKQYPAVVAWQERVIHRAQRTGFITNEWGRRMPTEPGREYTQTPALLGQSATHELLCQGLARLDDRHLKMIKITVHDAFTASIPKATMTEDLAYFRRKFDTTWSPEGGQPIHFFLEHGEPGRDWRTAAH